MDRFKSHRRFALFVSSKKLVGAFRWFKRNNEEGQSQSSGMRRNQSNLNVPANKQINKKDGSGIRCEGDKYLSKPQRDPLTYQEIPRIKGNPLFQTALQAGTSWEQFQALQPFSGPSTPNVCRSNQACRVRPRTARLVSNLVCNSGWEGRHCITFCNALFISTTNTSQTTQHTFMRTRWDPLSFSWPIHRKSRNTKETAPQI